jgi:hypothetical protein
LFGILLPFLTRFQTISERGSTSLPPLPLTECIYDANSIATANPTAKADGKSLFKSNAIILF